MPMESYLSNTNHWNWSHLNSRRLCHLCKRQFFHPHFGKWSMFPRGCGKSRLVVVIQGSYPTPSWSCSIWMKPSPQKNLGWPRLQTSARMRTWTTLFVRELMSWVSLNICPWRPMSLSESWSTCSPILSSSRSSTKSSSSEYVLIKILCTHQMERGEGHLRLLFDVDHNPLGRWRNQLYSLLRGRLQQLKWKKIPILNWKISLKWVFSVELQYTGKLCELGEFNNDLVPQWALWTKNALETYSCLCLKTSLLSQIVCCVSKLKWTLRNLLPVITSPIMINQYCVSGIKNPI